MSVTHPAADPTRYLATDFGAVADGSTRCHDALQAAIDAAHDAGGGAVVLTPGTYLSGSIVLRSRVTLHIERGATLLGSPDLGDYAEGEHHAVNGERNAWHLVSAADAHDIRITGGGTIDGNGPAFWEPTTRLDPDDPLSAVATRVLEADGPDHARLAWIRPNHQRRPSPMIDLQRCSDVTIDHVHLTNSPGWTCHPCDCDRVRIHAVRLTSNLMGPNNDGFDITGCHDVTVSDCHISCCDDAVCLKTFHDSRTVENIAVSNCVIRCWCAALKCGESYKAFRNISFSNCGIYESSRAVALYAYQGGTIDGVTISNIACDTRAPLMMPRPIHIDCRPKAADRPLGAVRNVSISNVVANTDGRVLLTGHPDSPLEHITLRDVTLAYPTVDDPSICGREVGGGQFSSHLPDARAARAALVAAHIDGLVIDNLQTHWPAADAEGRVDAPERWRFDRKAANGDFDLYPRAKFNPDTLTPMHAVWGRDLRRATLRNPLAVASTADAPRYDFAGCDGLGGDV